MFLQSTKMQINIKNCSYYVFNDMINIKSSDPSLLRVTKLPRENDDDLVIYNIKYETMKSLNPVFDSENSLCLILNNVDGYIIEKANNDK